MSLGISYAQANPLLIIAHEARPPRQAALAGLLGVEGPSLVRLLDQLASDGLVERHEDPTDRRAKTLHLTEAGAAMVAKAEAALTALRAELLADVPLADLQAAHRTIVRIADALHATSGHAPAAQPSSAAPTADETSPSPAPRPKAATPYRPVHWQHAGN